MNNGSKLRIRTDRLLPIFTWTMYLAATMMFMRSYLLGTTQYLNIPAYLSGRERLPFQERVLPIFFLDLFYRSPSLMRHFSHPAGVFSPENAPFFFLGLLSLGVACIFLIKLYRALSPSGPFGVLVYPFFLFSVMMTYSIHLEQNLRYPYDLVGVAFFAAGFYFIYTRRFLPLFFVILIGTLNRETTLFLIGIYILDAASHDRTSSDQIDSDHANRNVMQDRSKNSLPSRRFSFHQVPWLRVALLAIAWSIVKLTLAILFVHNDRSEDYLRIRQNLHTHPGTIPALLNLCGYLLPVVAVLHTRIRPLRFGNYIYILPVWFAVMFCTGILVEVRIYGELCPYAAIATVLLLEAACRAPEPPEPVST